jgi:hypothetical protein
MLDCAVRALSYTRLLQPTGKDRQLSFISKYLHNAINDRFPVSDTNSREVLDHNNGDNSWEFYRGTWVLELRELARTHRACCLEAVRLPGEHVLRTLDKALYVVGARKLKEKEEQQRREEENRARAQQVVR